MEYNKKNISIIKEKRPKAKYISIKKLCGFVYPSGKLNFTSSK